MVVVDWARRRSTPARLVVATDKAATMTKAKEILLTALILLISDLKLIPDFDMYLMGVQIFVVILCLVSQIMVVRPLKSIGKALKLSRRIPHALMQYDMDRCSDMSFPVHPLKRTHTWLEYPFTKDEE
ncbi:hypothetical protein ANCCEY_09509 [Ancylostoma ceylanicum]|uniref:Uncharacterized protein n=1 Tax=Ancylostoma ceylanicum TaxID=53326 RepID=A0A0D6LJR7_9BILA|nr:hypothetical protein ANCCEY_09509 [Ancylostoma ceylanicum]